MRRVFSRLRAFRARAQRGLRAALGGANQGAVRRRRRLTGGRPWTYGLKSP